MQLKLPPLLMPFFVMVFCFSASLVYGQATVTSDKDDYAPRSNAVFTGSGFQAFETVVLKVKNLDRACNTISADSSYLPWSVTADANGGFVTNWTVCDCPGDSLRLKAQGQTSGLIAYAYFTDGNVTFTTSGLPSGSTSVTVDYKYFTNGSTLSPELNKTTDFTVAVSNNKEVYFSYPSTVKVGENIYSLLNVSASVGSVSSTTQPGYNYQFTAPNATRTITGIYQLSCTAPSITTQPSSTSTTYGDATNPSFSVTASGTSPTYQWQQLSTNSGSTWSDIPDATNSSYSVASSAVSMNNYQYRVVVSGCNTSVTSNTATLKVNPRDIEVTADPQSKTYGDSDPELTYKVTNGSLIGSDKFSGNLGRVAGEDAGSYDINQNTLTAGINYNLTYKGASLTIGKADQVISWSNPANIIYGTALSAAQLNATALGGATLTYSNETGSILNAGQHTLTVTAAATANYKPGSKTVTLVVDQAPLSVKANDKTREYNAANPELDGKLTGVVSGDGITASYTTTATLASNVGEYAITATLNDPNGILDNYTVSNTPGKLTITPAPATISLSGLTKTYNGSAQGATVATLPEGLAINITYDGAASEPTNAGDYNVVVSLNDANYKAENRSGTFIIKKADATIEVTGYKGEYDGQAHGAEGSAKGVIKEDLSSLLELGNSFTNVPGGEANWTFKGNTNYNAASGTASIEISTRPVEVTADAKSKTYGDEDPQLTYQVTAGSLIAGDAFTGELKRAIGENAGIYAIEQNTLSAGNNYQLTYNGANFTIIKANQVITWANPANIIYGTALGNDQLNATALGGAVLTYTPAAGTVLGAGSRTLSVSAGETNNYNAASKEVTLVVEKATATISLSDLNHVYDGAVKNATATTNPSGLTGVSINNNGKTDAGTYEVEATLSNDNYRAEPVKGNLFIDKASTSISMANVSGTTGGLVSISATISPAVSGRTITFKLNDGSIGTAVTNASGIATLTTPACTNNATIEASFAGESNYKASANTAILSTVAPNYTWSGVNTTPIQLPTGGVTVTPVVNFAGVTLTNATFDWDNGQGAVPVPGTLTDQFAAGSYTYKTAGVYAPKLVGKDACGNTVTIRLEYLVIYDANGGFVTGGGWIYSLPGAYKADDKSEGKATFGFVAKYKKGSTSIVEGETEFQFHAGNLKFNSTAYENVSLVVGGAKASYKGTGTINGAGSYKFMLTAIDGQVTGGGVQDKIRMKITDAAGNVVYDNMMDALDNATPTTVLGGGSIVIHEVKATKSIDASQTLQLNRLEATESSQFNLQAFPNPSAAQFNLKLESNVTTEKIMIRVVDMHGRTVELLHNLVAGQTLQIGNDYRPGVYIVEMVQGNNRKQIKLLKQPN